ncbi:uncharacterized protein LOC108603640 [Drosophila busckii]|uniref:uncharacterized protein LOC108603640 n=1 Tax=Drosophila busckii TaxID=30019 RepID=UPI00083F19E1|nr:uncharacterized protein LOC108603640 [Drosophila busckii]
MGDKQVDLSVANYKDYEQYISSFTTAKDKLYLPNSRTAAGIIKLGYRSTKIPYDEEEYENRLNLAMQALHPKILGIVPFSRFIPPGTKDTVLLEFKKREVPNFTKRICTIVFITYTESDGSETSSYLDLEMSWKNAMRQVERHTPWQKVYEGHDRVKPLQHHLSYINHRSNFIKYTDSDNFRVLHDHQYGLMFMHIGDHKMIPVSNKPNPYSANVNRTMYLTARYGTIVFYDHVVRKKV